MLEIIQHRGYCCFCFVLFFIISNIVVYVTLTGHCDILNFSLLLFFTCCNVWKGVTVLALNSTEKWHVSIVSILGHH